MAGMYENEFVEALRQGLSNIIHEWDLSSHCSVTTLNISENATFKAVDPQTGKPAILRVHRPGYHDIDEIESELDWIHDLRRENVVVTPKPLPRADATAIGSMVAAGDVRHVVAFEFMSGAEPAAQDDKIVEGFNELGKISARLHLHARAWQRPENFRRTTWNFESMLGNAPLWGDWRDALGLTADGKAILEQTSAVLKKMLAEYGEGPERFGLIHADLRLANLLVDGDRLGVIDFDDCGFSWFVYDFASAISFFEDDPIIPKLQDAWVAGYREIAPLSDEDVAAIPMFIMLRRMLLTAWVASHAETPTAQSLGSAFTDGTVKLAQTFLLQHAGQGQPT
ncbi:aminoglycoside phosphotransferase [Hyphomicrobium methylovorum]|uniref:phosphotransferase enzyme family protein n=1 Tax=Hyphomicrobium methylovorum TaxID=84 RepID=UPI0015E631B7|nr:phosphotransferase enzyme family protein [Hyphomicrobium methylovorum]MBA2124958.1 aminoglycoside phosphotransferase [Hyphomicrobium methylovorum]